MHHELFTESVNKIALSADDNKGTILPDRINTLAHKTLAQTDKATGEAWQKALGAWGKDMRGTEGPWQSDREEQRGNTFKSAKRVCRQNSPFPSGNGEQSMSETCRKTENYTRV